MPVEVEAPAVPMVTLTIDDQEVRVPKGTLLIETARQMGINIPYLCYHHKLSPFGGCRLCLVEMEKARTPLVASCNTLVADGMVVRTNTDKVKSQRAGSIEFILLNHPLDCPVCDKGGECELQDRVFEREAFKPGFSGNTIVVCPVGALLSKPFRFRARPWELIKTPSVCSLCSMGCNVREDTRENRLMRVVGLENPRVNDGWLCDRGQFGYDYMNSPKRLRAPLLRRNGRLEEVSWDEALAF